MPGARCYPPHIALHCRNPTRQIASQMMAYGVGGVPGPGDWSHFFLSAPLYPGGPLNNAAKLSAMFQERTFHFSKVKALVDAFVNNMQIRYIMSDADDDSPTYTDYTDALTKAYQQMCDDNLLCGKHTIIP